MANTSTFYNLDLARKHARMMVRITGFQYSIYKGCNINGQHTFSVRVNSSFEDYPWVNHVESFAPKVARA